VQGERDELRKLKEKEIEFWRQVKTEKIRSTFKGTVWLVLQGPDCAKLFDVKNECELLDELEAILMPAPRQIVIRAINAPGSRVVPEARGGGHSPGPRSAIDAA